MLSIGNIKYLLVHPQTSTTPRLLSVARLGTSWSLLELVLLIRGLNECWFLLGLIGVLELRLKNKRIKYCGTHSNIRTGNINHQRTNVIHSVQWLSEFAEALAQERRELWDDGDAGSAPSLSSPEEYSKLEVSESTESSWMNSLKEETPLPSKFI